ncbi:MAG TPA: hypothetical protein VN032_08885 [Thermoanaerobaculia bacterium]|jgi:hypothetical protein|nr:hypothetical protein [Thermoanaerobaculia bacterium]
MAGDSGRRRALRIFAAARVVLALLLGGGAVLFLVHGRGHFARLGLPDSGRVALACAEIAAAALFVFRRTMPAGAVGLLMVLAWAAGLHFGVREPAAGLYVDMVLVAVVAHAEQIFVRD